MQNKGFVRVFAVLLTLVCAFYLSFSFVTNSYYNKAKEYAAGDPLKESHYLDSLSTEKVWLGYTLKKCRTMELNLGLDLKGGMNVILEINVADVLKSLSNDNPDPNFNQALANARERQAKSKKDFVSLFVEEYHKLDPGARLSVIFGTFELKDKITTQTSDAAVESILREEIKSAMDNSFNVLRTRIDRFGVVAPNIKQLDTDGRILIELPGIKDPARVRKLLQGSANLEFWGTKNFTEIYQDIDRVNKKLAEIAKVDAKGASESIDPQEVVADDALAESKGESIAEKTSTDLLVENAEEEHIEGLTQTNTDSLGMMSAEDFAKENPLYAVLNISVDQEGRILPGPVVGVSHYRDTATVNAYFNNPQVKNILPKGLLLKWTVKAFDEKEQYYQLIALDASKSRDGKAPLEGDVIIDASSDFGQHSPFAEVSMAMNAEGAKKWARLTKENIGRSVAIVLDEHVYSFPTVNSEITGGRSSITGNFTAEEGKDLANVLKSGKMSAPARIIQEDVIGPSLGQEAITQGFISFIVALLALMLYLVLVYGFKPGMIANVALLLNLFFTIGILASFQAVLTLSGIAGLVLALAIAVDANVLIYERIKEELRGGKTLKKAVDEGYKKAFSAIFDSNLTSIMTGVILFVFGTGPIRGFATTLIIGIVTSFITAVFLTRLFYETSFAKGRLLDLTFTTNLTKNFLVNPTYDFLKKRKLVYVVITCLTVICVVALGWKGLNQGIDFTGGRNYVVRFDQAVNTAEAQTMLESQFEGSVPSVITIGSPNQVRISTNYMITDSSEEVDSEIETKLYEGLKPLLKEGTSEETFLEDYVLSSQKVGPSIADDIKQGAILAVIFAVLAIGLYILLRFRDVSYSVGTVVSLIQDALFILGIYAIFWGILPFSLEIDQTFIGAILTALGYSVNDKVVIFDRVREYSHIYPKRDKESLFNLALNSTLDRTFNTSVSTFLVLMIIFAFAGDTIRSFSFAMIIGVVMGTFSSLFIAAPIAFEIQNKKFLKKQALHTHK
ncbi:protein translocase subunit SecDF [Bacteroidales bacterium]|nr:protein translocase subunit SecDF [Bacteroidales bacterium]